MARGRRLESVALAEYSALMGHAVVPVCCVHDEIDWLKASLDGWNGEKKIVVEVKAPRKEEHELALANGVPVKYRTQTIHQLLVTGAPLLHYVSYNDYFPAHRRLAVVPVLPVREELEALLAALKEFWWHVENRVPPGGEGKESHTHGKGRQSDISPRKTVRSRKVRTSGVKVS